MFVGSILQVTLQFADCTTFRYSPTMNDSPHPLAADAGLVGLAAIWGVNFSVVKIVFRELDPLALNALRFPLAAAVFWLVLRPRRGPRGPERRDVPRILLLAAIGHVVYQICFVVGLDRTLAGNASLLLATSPAWTVALSALAGHERPHPRVLAGIACTILGIMLVVLGGGNGAGLDPATARGDLLMLLASLLWAAFTVWGRAPVARYGPLRITAWTLWAATPALVLLGVPSLARTDLTGVSAGTWLGVVYAGVMAVAVAYVLWYRGVQILGNSRTAVYANLVPVAALASAWLWLGEAPGPLQLAGAAVILGGVTVSRTGQSPAPSSFRWRSSGNS